MALAAEKSKREEHNYLGVKNKIGKLLQIEPDIDSRSGGTAERGKWMFQVQLLLDNYNNWRGNCSMIREKSGEFHFK